MPPAPLETSPAGVGPPLHPRSPARAARTHHRLDVAAYPVESLVGDGKLTVPGRETPLCVFGVRA